VEFVKGEIRRPFAERQIPLPSATSAASGAKEPIEHLLIAVELALVDITTGFESIAENDRTCTIHQRLPRHLHLATCAAKYVAEDLPKNVSPGHLL
jgi:hypothetical protein